MTERGAIISLARDLADQAETLAELVDSGEYSPHMIQELHDSLLSTSAALLSLTKREARV